MTPWKAIPAGFLAALLAGCSTTPPLKPEPVAVNGTVLLPGGQPARDVVVNFLPTGSDQMQGAAQLKSDGKFSVKLTPGKYTYSFEGNNLKAIPAKYHSNNADNTFEVPAAGDSNLTLKLEK
jgi:hypothetical protein